MTEQMFEGLFKGLLKTAEASVRAYTSPSWSAEERAEGRPFNEMLRTAATGLSETMAAAHAAAAAERVRDTTATEVIERRLGELEDDDHLQTGRAQRAQRGPRSLEEPLPPHLVEVYRVIVHHLHLQGASLDQIRECIRCDARPRQPVPGADVARRLILKARRRCGQAEVEAVRDVIATPAVFSVLFGCLIGRESYDA